MRKIILTVFILFFLFFNSKNYSHAGQAGPNCASCDKVDGKKVFLQYDSAVGRFQCIYQLNGTEGDPTVLWDEKRDPKLEGNEGTCPSGKSCSPDFYKGCLDGPPEDNSCVLNGSEGPCTKSESCRKRDTCTTYYCVEYRGSTPYEVTESYSIESSGKKGLCENLSTPPALATVDRNLNENSPLSLPCLKNGNSYSDARGCLRIKTAFGYVSTGTSEFTRWVLGFVLSIAGGIVFIIILISGYKIMTSQGDPDKVKNAREQLTAAIVGFIFIIFSLVILELITRDILGLPGFGG